MSINDTRGTKSLVDTIPTFSNYLAPILRTTQGVSSIPPPFFFCLLLPLFFFLPLPYQKAIGRPTSTS